MKLGLGTEDILMDEPHFLKWGARMKKLGDHQ